jgi:hypothetical protein
MPGADHLIGGRCVPPPGSVERRPDRVVILAPRGDINVGGLTGYGAYQKSTAQPPNSQYSIPC